MPIYEYRCRNCGAVTEVLVISPHAYNAPTCGACGSSDLEKQPSRPAGVAVGNRRPAGHTCCGKEERCETPPCSSGGRCRRD